MTADDSCHDDCGPIVARADGQHAHENGDGRCWHADGAGVTVGQLTWLPHHEWDNTTQVDGYLMPGNVQLDMACTSDLQVDVHDDAMAEIAWMRGGVHVGDRAVWGAMTLIVPGSTLTPDTVREALRRFKP